MISKRSNPKARWAASALGLAAIVVVYDNVLRVNSTTVALTLLLYILFLATRWGLRYSIATSLAAAACYSYFFLPPLHSFNVADPQNSIALLVLLTTSVVASRLSNRIRAESRQAFTRQAELEVLYSLSRGLLQTDQLALLTASIPDAVALACGARSALFYTLAGPTTYHSSLPLSDPPTAAQLHALASDHTPTAVRTTIPLRTGTGPIGVLLLSETTLSAGTLTAIGGLVAAALERARAVQKATHAEAAKQNERLRTMMIDSITHEIRTPLTAIKGSISTLRHQSLPPEAVAELHEVIEQEADRLNRLVAQSVEMSQLATLEISMSLEPQPLAILIESVLQAATHLLAGRAIQLDLPASLPLVTADRIWLPKLLANLLENAVKYSPPGTPIHIAAEPRGALVACSITDQGPGIALEEQPFLFDKFYRSPRAALISGTGMGLAICRAIAEAHGGTIAVDSLPGHGATFTVQLPAAIGTHPRTTYNRPQPRE